MNTVFATVASLAFAGPVVSDIIYVPAGGDIQAAINGASDGDVIQLEAGEYLPAATINTNEKAVMLRGSVDAEFAPTTAIDGQGAICVFRCSSGEGKDTIFQDLIIRDGANENGAGMACIGSSPTLINCKFSSNTAIYSGGGMYNSSNSNPTLIGCDFVNNSADGGSKGKGQGGGMFNYNSDPTLIDCTFSNSWAAWGGGMYNGNSNPILNGCSFSGGDASWEGAGMYNDSNSLPMLRNCTFQGNYAIDGGGMFNYNTSPTLTNCTFVNNNPNPISGPANLVFEETDTCLGDINGDGEVNGADLGLLIAAWGPCLP